MNKQLGLGLFLGFLYVLVLRSNPNAASYANHFNLAGEIGFYGLLTLGAGILIISGGIDLSIGSVVGLAATLCAVFLVDYKLPPELAIPLVLLIGAAIGLIHGLLVTYLQLQPFIVTLCGLFIYRGLARWISGGLNRGLGSGFQDLKELLYRGVYDVPMPRSLAIPLGATALSLLYVHVTKGWGALGSAIRRPMQSRRVLKNHRAAQRWQLNLVFDVLIGVAILCGFLFLPDLVIPLPKFMVLFLIACLAATVYLHLSVYGRYLFAIGSNVEAALYSGVPIRRHKIAAYVICSLLASFTGVLLLLRVNSVTPSQSGSYFELYAIAGAVLGGCSLRGGEGSVLGMMIGTAILALLPNLTMMWNIPDDLEYTVIGVALLCGALIDELFRRGTKKRLVALASWVVSPLRRKPPPP